MTMAPNDKYLMFFSKLRALFKSKDNFWKHPAAFGICQGFSFSNAARNNYANKQLLTV